MTYTASYASPLGEALLASDGSALTGLWFAGQKHFAAGLAEDVCEESDLPVFEAVRAWLDAYFAGEEPGPLPPVAFAGTPFQHMVWEELLRIPRGETCTYGDLVQHIGERRGAPTSARAVGTAVGAQSRIRHRALSSSARRERCARRLRRWRLAQARAARVGAAGHIDCGGR